MTVETIHGRRRFVAFTTQPNQRGYATTLIDRVGPSFQCFQTPAEIGANYVCASLCDDQGQVAQELRAKVIRLAPLAEIHEVLKQHPNAKQLKLHPKGQWYEIHAD